MPSRASSAATPPMSASVFRRGRERSILSIRTSGSAPLKICTCLTCPAMIAFSTPSRLKKRIIFPSCPMPTHVTRAATFSIAGSVSSRMAATASSAPARRAPSTTRKGNLPLPAMSPKRIRGKSKVQSLKLCTGQKLNSPSEISEFSGARQVAYYAPQVIQPMTEQALALAPVLLHPKRLLLDEPLADDYRPAECQRQQGEQLLQPRRVGDVRLFEAE